MIFIRKKNIAYGLFVIGFTLFTLYTDFKRDKEELELREETLELASEWIEAALDYIHRYEQKKDVKLLYNAMVEVKKIKDFVILYQIDDENIGKQKLEPIFESYLVRMDRVVDPIREDGEFSPFTNEWMEINAIQDDLEYVQFKLEKEDLANYSSKEFKAYIKDIQSNR
ncbi:hypothetical protein [Radiobacillus deserti]|uniref:Uncharacterized protein n=1 Tax=Radiobacillus deserti TaxID=2594883 RepID=A0A516KI69_9BACI|nr:hypothetical protein [Radiobacillus deserti]QDP41090.1 hypothetical protein FN924_13345 [Radiobacillus deserti]